MQGQGQAEAPLGEEDGFAAFRLPSGRHGLPRELVAASRRWRLLGAVGELLAADGPVRISSAAIARRAGVSKSAFYAEFANVEDCLRTAGAAACRLLGELAEESCAGGGDREERLRRVVAEFLRIAHAEPSLLSVVSTAAAASDPGLAESRERLIESLADLLGDRPASRAVVGAALLLVCDRPFLEGAQVEDLEPQLVRLLR